MKIWDVISGITNIKKYLVELGIAVVLISAAIFYGYSKGVAKADIKIAEYEAKHVELSNFINVGQVKVVDRIVTKYVTKIVKVAEVEKHNEEVAKVFVPDVNILSNGWVYNHDSSARGLYADPTRSSDGSPSGIEANQALSTIDENYGTCLKTREQLIGLQTWIIESKKNIEEANKKKK